MPDPDTPGPDAGADTGLRPSDLALLHLAAADAPPRARARDQQADLAGLDLSRRVLDALVELDPEPDELEAALSAIVARLGPPEGPTRAVCALLRDEWRAAALQPHFADWLLGEALAAGAREGGRRRRNRPDAR